MMGGLMSLDKFTARVAGLALAGAVFAAAATAHAGVVVRSSGPSASQYPVGKQVADTAKITLRAGDRITVLTDTGTSVLQGPGDFVVGEGATRTRSRFSNLTRRGSGRVRTGAVRGAGDAAPPEGPQSAPSLWFVDLGASGTICLYELDRVRLWRPVANEPQNYSILDQTTQTTLDVTFVGTETMRAWDAEALPLVVGHTYSITGPLPVPSEEGESRDEASAMTTPPTTTSVTFAMLNEDYRDQTALAAALIERGCNSQLAQLTNELEETAAEVAR